MNPTKFLHVLIIGSSLSLSLQSYGYVSFSTYGGNYSQNFDSLPTTPENTSLQATTPWVDDSTSSSTQISLPGWYLYHPLTPSSEAGSNGHQRFRNSAGSVNTGSFYSFGTSGSSERALGDIGSTTIAANNADIYMGLRLRNDTGQALDRFTLSYNGEQWRDGGATTPVAQNMSFMWSTLASAINDPNALFTTEPALGYSSPVFVNTGSGAAVDGNNAGHVTVGPVTVTGLYWAPGTDLWLRWDDIQNAGNDHGLAIDDVSFSAIPEPSTGAMLVLGAMIIGFVKRIRRG